MFWSLLIVHTHSTQEPASIVKKNGVIYFILWAQNQCYPQLTQEKLLSAFEKKVDEWT